MFQKVKIRAKIYQDFFENAYKLQRSEILYNNQEVNFSIVIID